MAARKNEWSNAFAERRAWRMHDGASWARSLLTRPIHPAGSTMPQDEQHRLEEAKDELANIYHRPTTGRNTQQGRRVEKPGCGDTPGPSGQRESVLDRTHANK